MTATEVHTGARSLDDMGKGVLWDMWYLGMRLKRSLIIRMRVSCADGTVSALWCDRRRRLRMYEWTAIYAGTGWYGMQRGPPRAVVLAQLTWRYRLGEAHVGEIWLTPRHEGLVWIFIISHGIELTCDISLQRCSYCVISQTHFSRIKQSHRLVG